MEKIGVEALFKTDAFQKGLTTYTKGLASAEQKGNLFTKGMTTLGAVGGAVLASGLAIGAAALAATGAALVSCVTAGLEAEKVMATTAAVIKSTGGVAGVTAKDVDDLAVKFAMLTKFDDETVASAENMLLTFTGIHKDVFPQATEAVLNLAEKFGSTEQAAVQVGKALNDPISGVTALRRVGVMLTDQQEKQIKSLVAQGKTTEAQKIILGELETEFGGLAVAMGQTTEGTFARFNNMMDLTKDRIGLIILPLLTKLGNTFMTALSTPAMQANIDKIASLISKLATGLIDFLSSPTVQKGLSDMVDGFGALLDTISNSPILGTIKTLFAAMGGGASAGYQLKNVLVTLGRNLLSFLPAWVIDSLGEFEAGLATMGVWWNTYGPGIQATASSIFTNLMAAVQRLAQQVLPWLMAQFTKLAAWMTANGPLIQAFITNLGIAINWLVNAVVGMWSFIGPALATIMDAFLGLAKFVMQLATGDWTGAWNTIKLVVVNLLGGMVQLLNQFFDWVAGLMGTSMGAIRQTWSDNWNMVKTIVDQFFTNMAKSWTDDWNMLQTINTAFWRNLVTGIANQVSNVVNSVRNIITSVKTYLSNVIKDFYNLGKNIIQGLIDGAKSMASALIGAVSGTVNDAIANAKKLLGIKSPSKVFMDIGQNMMLGLAQGVMLNAKAPAAAVAMSVPAGAITNNYSIANSRTTLNGATFNVPQSVTLSEFLSNARSF
jgi:phage-related protein